VRWPAAAGLALELSRAAAEDDDTLTAEEKAVARFQKERMKALGGALAACLAGCWSKGTPGLCSDKEATLCNSQGVVDSVWLLPVLCHRTQPCCKTLS